MSACCSTLLVTTLPHRAEAAEGKPVRAVEPAIVQGVVHPGREAGRTWAEIASVLLFVPRVLESLLFRAQALGAHLVRDERIVSRVDELFSPRPGALAVFPTLFFASRQPPSAGARVLVRGDHVAAALAAGIGSAHNISVENRISFDWGRPFRFVINLEALADSRSGLMYTGVGQTPASDPRNSFRPGQLVREARYLERRSRAIADVRIRPHPELEILLSGSYTQSRVGTSPGAVPVSLDQVFTPGTVPGAVTPTRIFYGEMNARFDTRPVIGRPMPGVVLALYTGIARGNGDDAFRFFRFGGRTGIFVPIVRPSNILSLKLTADAMARSARDHRAIPFTSLVSQPEFRGFNTRRDFLGVVASVDYRWSVMHLLGARLFVDAATVAPRIGALVAAPPRIAAGFGVDFFGDTSELGQLSVAFTREGARVLLSFGLAPAFGDRQHRD
jgi:hypothetical protein